MATTTFDIVREQSGIDWTGRKINGSHNGTIGIQAGTITLENDKVTGGKFVIDTKSIKILDVTDPGTNAQFAGHLASDDFFSSDAFPTAVFETNAVVPIKTGLYHVDGSLTIKGITAPVEFDVTVAINGSTIKASGKMTVDRTLYGMKFRSGNFFKDLGDTLIYNDFDLTVHITASAA
jgi:polyisoprenoid-binding protein YceI